MCTRKTEATFALALDLTQSRARSRRSRRVVAPAASVLPKSAQVFPALEHFDLAHTLSWCLSPFIPRPLSQFTALSRGWLSLSPSLSLRHDQVNLWNFADVPVLLAAICIYDPTSGGPFYSIVVTRTVNAHRGKLSRCDRWRLCATLIA